MRRTIIALMALAAALTSHAVAQAPSTALVNPDLLAWQLFAYVNAPVGPGIARFETWASDEDTFVRTPVWPQTATATRIALSPPALSLFRPLPPGLRVPPGGGEEVRRNQAAFDFIVKNNLYTRAGLQQAFARGRRLIFPNEAIEVKAEWVPVETVKNPVLYYVSTASDGKQYALTSMHIISKLTPNWTWATFEHQNNPGRCDYIGCIDTFGARVPIVPAEPTSEFGMIYPTCWKTVTLLVMLGSANLPGFWQNYCLKGSQIVFTEQNRATGNPTLLGNTVSERGFVNTASCMTCHARAAFDVNGRPTPDAGFLDPQQFPALCPTPNQSIFACSPNGTPLTSWFWRNFGTPDQQMIFMQADCDWSIPFKAW
jgi:hypothetical protein